MIFFKLLRYDIREGILQQYKNYLLTAAVFLLSCIDFYIKSHNNFFNNNQPVPQRTVADYLFYCFAGMNEYKPASGEPFRFPVLWMLLYLTVSYMTIYYPHRSLSAEGQHIMVRSDSRQAWWLSKCLWNMFSVVIFFIVGWFVILVFTVCSGGGISLDITKEYIFFLSGIYELNDTQYTDMVIILYFLPLFAAVTLNLMQMTLSLMIKPIYSFMAIAVILLSSAYYVSPWLIGNYAMALRSQVLISNGYQSASGMILCTCLSAGSIVAGLGIFKQYDILNRGEQE